MKFSTAVVTIPKRLPLAKTLASQLKAEIICDVKGNGSWWGHRQAMLKYRGDYHLVLEDDVSLCKDFIEGLDQIVGLFPDNPVSLFNMATFTSINAHAQKLGINFVGTNGATGQAQLWPVPILKKFIMWCDRNVPELIPFEDTRLWLWLNQTRTSIYLTCPNLVEHLLPDHSSLGFHGKNRHSADFLGHRSAALIDWSNNLELAKNTHLNKYDYSTFWKKYGIST